MRTSVSRYCLGLFLLLQCLLTVATAQVQAGKATSDQYPNKPIKLIVPFAAGSTTDMLSRVVSQRLTKPLEGSIVVENRTGAGGIIAAESVARAAPDGYTLLAGGTAILAIIPSLAQKVSFDPVKDFAPVSLIAETPYVLVVHPSVAATSVKELLALAKANPGILNYGSGGNGTASHLSGEVFASMGKVSIVHIAYKTGEKIDFLAGRLQMFFGGFGGMLPEIKSGKARALGITSAKRNDLLPNVPTIAEAGLPGYETSPWLGMLATARTPAPIVNRINASLIEILSDASLRTQFRESGIELMANSPEVFSTFIASEIKKWGGAVRAAGLDVEK